MFFRSSMMLAAASMVFLASCAKDGEMGATGPAGKDGKDANETCKLCHTPSVVDRVSVEFQLSKHEFGTAAEEEAGSVGCAACHEHEGFLYVCKNNTSVAFYQDSATGPWKNGYNVPANAAYGKITCFTCHSSLHTTYGYSDMSSLTTTAAVPLTMWGAAKKLSTLHKMVEKVIYV